MLDKSYDLEQRTFEGAKKISLFIKDLPHTIANKEDAKQLVRTSVSIGANYIEANEAFNKKDFIYQLKISRKEAKESIYWLKRIKESNKPDNKNTADLLLIEPEEIRKILSLIINKTELKT